MTVYLRFKFWILGRVARWVAKDTAPMRCNVGLSKATTVGVLYSYTAPAKHEIVQRFVRQLKNLNKKVSVLCYKTPKDRMHASSNLVYAFEHKAVTLLGTFGSSRIQQFADTPFDYLFHVDLDSNAVLDCIVAKSQARCRVGCFDPSRKPLLEIMIKVRATAQRFEDTKRLVQHMFHYTSQLEG
jgi:hypothetical protein